MKKLFFFFILLILAPPEIFAAGRVQNCVLPQRELDNGIVRVGILPDAEGRIVSLKFRGIEFFSPFKVEKIAGNPLFSPVAGNARGWGERFWKRQFSSAPFAAEKILLEPGKCHVSVKCLGNSELSLEREMTLPPSSAVLIIRSHMSSEKRDDSGAFSMTVFPPLDSRVFFPVFKEKQQEAIASPGNLDNTCYYRPAANFVWCRYKGVIMAVWIDDADFMMSWRARDTVEGRERTMEIIGVDRKFPSVWVTGFAFFSKLDRLNGICDARGFEIVCRNGQYYLRLEAAADVPSRSCRVDKYSVTLPAQKYGDVTEIMLPGKPERIFPQISLL